MECLNVISIRPRLLRPCQSSTQVIGTNTVAPAREQNGRNYGRDIDPLHKREQSVVSKYAVAKEQRTGNKPY